MFFLLSQGGILSQHGQEQARVRGGGLQGWPEITGIANTFKNPVTLSLSKEYPVSA